MPRNRRRRRINAKGRNTDHASAAGPRTSPTELCEGRPWAWLPAEIFNSAGWGALSPNGMRLIFCILAEHVAKRGKLNGRLIVTHAQMKNSGMSGNSIKDAIDEAVAFGFVDVVQGGRFAYSNQPNLYALTWFDKIDEMGIITHASFRYRSVSADMVKMFKNSRRILRTAKRGDALRKSIETPNSDSSVVVKLRARPLAN